MALCWADTNYVKMTDEELAAAQFDQGQAFWIKSTLATTVSLVPSGAVGTSDIGFTLNTKGNTGVGVARPSQLTLGDLTISGYDLSQWDPDDEEFKGGVKGGAIVLQTLTKGGAIDAQYYWLDYKVGLQETKYTEYNGWYKYESGSYVKLTQSELDAIVYAPGAGFWFKSTMNKEGIVLNVPAVELN